MFLSLTCPWAPSKVSLLTWWQEKDEYPEDLVMSTQYEVEEKKDKKVTKYPAEFEPTASK